MIHLHVRLRRHRRPDPCPRPRPDECPRPRPRRGIVALTATGAAGLLLAACAAPQYTYVKDSPDSAYFKLPPGWMPISQHLLTEVQTAELGSSQAGLPGGALTWSRAFDASAPPSATHVFEASRQPVVYASVQAMTPAARLNLSFDGMRDLLLPVTAAARAAAKKAGAPLSGFQSIGNQVIIDSGGVRGINELFEYNFGPTPEIFDQTVLTNNQTTKLYLLLVHCSQACFVAHKSQIATVVRSFTVRGS